MSNRFENMRATGGCCVALGVNAKIVPRGKCLYPDKLSQDALKKVPQSKHCVFCRDNEMCYFNGNCDWIGHAEEGEENGREN